MTPEMKSLPRHDAASMNRAHPVETRKALLAAATLAAKGVRFVPVPAFSDEEFAGLMELAAKKLDKATAEARKKNE